MEGLLPDTRYAAGQCKHSWCRLTGYYGSIKGVPFKGTMVL